MRVLRGEKRKRKCTLLRLQHLEHDLVHIRPQVYSLRLHRVNQIGTFRSGEDAVGKFANALQPQGFIPRARVHVAQGRLNLSHAHAHTRLHVY